MTLTYSAIALIGASFLFTSAGFSADADVLEGKWKDNDCQYTSQYGKGYTKRTYVFDTEEDTALLKTKVYSDKNCKTKKFEYRVYADLTTKVTSKKKSKGNFSVEYRNQTIRPMTDAVAKQFNRSRVCGLTKWESRQELDVNGRSCLGMSVPKAGHFHKGTYNVNSDGDRVKITYNNVNGKKHVVKLEKVD